MIQGNLIAIVLLLGLSAPSSADNDPSLLPLEAFASLPRVSAVTLSPSGKYLAVVRNENGMTYLTTQLASGADPHVVVNSDNSDYFIQDYQWVNDERFLVSVRFGSSRGRVESFETRLMAVNRDGTEAKPALVSPRRDALLADHYSQFQDRIIGHVPGDAKHVLIALDKDNPNIPNVYQLDVYSGGLTLVQANPGNREGIGAIRHWIVDRQGRVRAGISDSQTMRRVMIRRKGSDRWEEFAEFDRTKERGIVPLGFDENPDILYVRAVHDGRWAVFKVNVEQPDAPRQLVAADAHSDIDGDLLYSPWLRAVVGMAHSPGRKPYLYWENGFNACIHASTGCCLGAIPVSSAAPMMASATSSPA